MPFYTGVANSFTDLRTALFNACVAEGWTLTGDILTKGAAAIKFTINTVNSASLGTGLVMQGGTGISAGSLVDPSTATPRLGPPSSAVSQPTWPMAYDIHIRNDPDEVYLIANFNVDYFLWQAFGISSIPVAGTGLWLGAISRGGSGPAVAGINISPTTGGTSGGVLQASSGAIFWNTNTQSTALVSANEHTMNVGFDGVNWSNASGAATVGYMNAIAELQPRMGRQPNNWNSEAVLLPIQPYLTRSSNKKSLVADLKHARYLRIDNYTPRQIITLGPDRWMTYPFYRKNSAARDGGNNIDHSGTFGWAIRYDGP